MAVHEVENGLAGGLAGHRGILLGGDVGEFFTQRIGARKAQFLPADTQRAERRPGVGAGNLGLPGMGERARMIGGTLSVRSAPNAGTQVILMVPYAESQEAPTEEAARPAVSQAEPLRQGMQVRV